MSVNEVLRHSGPIALGMVVQLIQGDTVPRKISDISISGGLRAQSGTLKASASFRPFTASDIMVYKSSFIGNTEDNPLIATHKRYKEYIFPHQDIHLRLQIFFLPRKHKWS